jgi:hypothetical protein
MQPSDYILILGIAVRRSVDQCDGRMIRYKYIRAPRCQRAAGLSCDFEYRTPPLIRDRTLKARVHTTQVS